MIFKYISNVVSLKLHAVRYDLKSVDYQYIMSKNNHFIFSVLKIKKWFILCTILHSIHLYDDKYVQTRNSLQNKKKIMFVNISISY